MASRTSPTSTIPRPISLKLAKPDTRLLKLEETPAWYEPNQYVLTGYRPQSKSTANTFLSWTYLHNETCNIYSHLVPAVGSVVGQWALHRYISDQYPFASRGDQLVLSFHALTATICLGTSSMFHTFNHHSPRVSRGWLVCDFIGILILTFGNFISGIYFGFYSERNIRFAYWSMISVLSFLTAIFMLNPYYQGPEYRNFRLASFVSTALSGFAPVIHGAIIFDRETFNNSGIPFYLLEGALLILAAYIYGISLLYFIFQDTIILKKQLPSHKASNPRTLVSGPLRHLGPFAYDISCAGGDCDGGAFLRAAGGF
ncbi:hypothetical protein FQN51_003730 [Onygenales sp. PD_10]|nr:hypothetical protein FQN51_003730 [Onygenales sp. PD_10]